VSTQTKVTPRSHTINVTISGKSITVKPDRLEMYTIDDVRWAGQNAHKFSIVFDNPAPFGRELKHAIASTKQKPKAGSKTGEFKYTVVSEETPGLKLDPTIIIDPPPTPNP
jgi:hypothetical protein